MRYFKIFFAVLFVAFVIINLVSCTHMSNISPPANAPNYLKNVYNDLVKEGIKVTYNPEILEAIPAPQKPYSPFPRDIPSNWIASELEWTQYKSPVSPYGLVSLDDFYGDYVLETVPKEGYKAPSSRPNSIKLILKLYKRKNIIEPLPNKLTKSDYELLKVLDKAPEDQPYPQNQEPKLSDHFVVWQASSNEFDQNWEIWGYDINKDKTFLICSYNDYKISQNSYPIYTMPEDKNVLLVNLVTQDPDGKLRSEIIIYDLTNEKISEVLKSDKYIYSSPTFAGNYLYVNRSDLNQNIDNKTQYAPSSVIRIYPYTGEEKVIIPNANFFVASSFQYKVCLVSLDPNYQYNDIWVFDTIKNDMTCYMKVPIEDNITPGVSLTQEGILYAGGQSREIPYYFYSFSKKKAFYTGPLISKPDNLGRFLIMKQPLDVYYPVPPFDYEGKAKRLEGYNTLLIIEPN